MRWDEQKLKIFDVSAEESASDERQEQAKRTASMIQRALMMGGAGEARVQPTGDLEAEVKQTIAHYLAETFGQAFDLERIKPGDSPAGARILASPPPVLRMYVRSIIQWMLDRPGGEVHQLQPLITAIVRQGDKWEEATLCDLVTQLSEYSGRYLWPLPTAGVLRIVERYLADHPLGPPLRQALDDLRRLYRVRASGSDDRKIFLRINQLLESAEPPDARLEFCTGEAWTTALAAVVNAEPAAQRARWRSLLAHAATATSPVARPAWLKQAAVLRDAVGTEAFCRVIGNCLRAVGRASDGDRFHAPFEHRLDRSQIHEQYSDLLRGLVWCAGSARAAALVRVLGEAAERCFERLPRKQPRSLKVAVACIQALAMYRDRPALEELVRLQTRARQASIKQKLAAAVDSLQQIVPLAPHELDELSVPDLELSDFGVYQRQVGQHIATITIESPGATRLSWHSPNKPPQHSVPPAVKSFHGDEWAGVRKRHREIVAELPRLKLRLERLLMSRAQWRWADFRRHYLDHPLVGTFARAMIWSIANGGRWTSAIWHNGQWQDRSLQCVSGTSDESLVRPWHPLMSPPDDVLGWQRSIEAQGICQPFKQAHREVYLRLPDERDETLESQRFVGHRIECDRLERIVPERGWRLRSRSQLAALHSPDWDLPEWNLRARWSTRPYSELEAHKDPEPNSLSITFESLDSGQPVPLGQVPALVYSEVMRDVECFFLQYAASENFVINDSHTDNEWMRSYWRKMALGPLSVQGQVRKTVLERLLPRSKLAECSQIDGDFLCVRGEWNFYRIHLDSGTVEMGPSRAIIHPYGYPFSPEHLGLPPLDAFPRLPFGGDIRLACILRNASRLAHESKITEQQLVDQISRSSRRRDSGER